MAIINSNADDTGTTLAERFSAHLESVTNPSDIALPVRSCDRFLRDASKSPKTIKPRYTAPIAD